MKILVTGSGGMVGRAVVNHCSDYGDQVFPYDHKALDISDRSRVQSVIEQDQPDAVINCAAWTDVDGCETDRERAFAANAQGPENLALACREVHATLLTISTDYVFDGRKEGFYTQRDQPHPESVYGQSKLEGEQRSQLAHQRTIVVRTGFVFGPGGTNFLSTVLDRARQNQPMKVISDAYGTPTYAPDMAKRLRELVELDATGIFHVVNAGAGVSYEEFARAAIELAGGSITNLESVQMATLKRPAPRPVNSRMKCLLSEAIGLPQLPDWKDALARFAALKFETSAAPGV